MRTARVSPQKTVVVVRVDMKQGWFRGYDQFGRTQVTGNIEKAAHLTEREAEIVMYDLKFERGGVWSARKVKE